MVNFGSSVWQYKSILKRFSWKKNCTALFQTHSNEMSWAFINFINIVIIIISGLWTLNIVNK